jgi:hypothetical protein
MSDTARSLLALLRPCLSWALHFTALYALISAACAPRALLGPESLLLASGGATLLGLALCLWSVLAPPRAGPPELRRAAYWSGLISALAVLANAAVFLFLHSCGG